MRKHQSANAHLKPRILFFTVGEIQGLLAVQRKLFADLSHELNLLNGQLPPDLMLEPPPGAELSTFASYS
jgi:hypothetical protein